MFALFYVLFKKSPNYISFEPHESGSAWVEAILVACEHPQNHLVWFREEGIYWWAWEASWHHQENWRTQFWLSFPNHRITELGLLTTMPTHLHHTGAGAPTATDSGTATSAALGMLYMHVCLPDASRSPLGHTPMVSHRQTPNQAGKRRSVWKSGLTVQGAGKMSGGCGRYYEHLQWQMSITPTAWQKSMGVQV